MYSVFKKLVDEHLASGDYETAVFWAEKIVSQLPGSTVADRLPEYAQYLETLTAAAQWQMIVTFISRHDLFLRHIVFAQLHVNALFKRGMFNEIINLPLGSLSQWEEVPFITPDTSLKIAAFVNQIRDERTRRALDALAMERKSESRLLFVLARTYLTVQNRPAASGCIRHCLRLNPFSSEAVYLALESRLLSVIEIQAIIAPSAGINKSAYDVIKLILDLHDVNNNSVKVVNSSDLSTQSALAYRFYRQGDIAEAYKISSRIIYEFGWYNKCFLMHVCCLVELSRVSELYALGHSMVKMQPEKEITWYTVGCYYFATGQYATAKKFLNKCTQINAGFGEGWLAFGHTLFYADEHEQAMNCYLRASRILEGHFEPLLYIAVEYCFANNFKFAYEFLRDAQQIAGFNPIVLHEQATTAYMKAEFTKAEQLFYITLNLLTTKRSSSQELPSLREMLTYNVSDYWEPVYRNLGHTLRQLTKYEDAIEAHRKSLLLTTNKSDAWGAIGICYASMGELDQAIEALNMALTLKPTDDSLRSALEKVMACASRMPLSGPIGEGTEENIEALAEQTKSKELKPSRQTRRIPGLRNPLVR